MQTKVDAGSSKLDVIFIHGFHAQMYFDKEYDNLSTLTENSKDTFKHWNKFFGQKTNVLHAPWDVKNTLVRNTSDPSDNRPGWQKVADRVLAHIENGYGSKGFLFITHSTGGLVADTMLSQCYFAKYSSNPKIKKYYKVWQKTVAMIHVASAAGGTTVANYANDVVNGAGRIPFAKSIIKKFFPFIDFDKPESLGVGYDLQPSIARSENGSSYIRVPAFNIAGNGPMALNILKWFLKGEDDGLIAMHSACGGNKYGSYQSCTKSKAPDGRVRSRKAPDNYRYHYPYMMSMEGHLSLMNPGSSNHHGDKWKETETLISNYGNWSNVQQDKRTTGRWFWKKTYYNVKNDERTIGEIIATHFNLYK